MGRKAHFMAFCKKKRGYALDWSVAELSKLIAYWSDNGLKCLSKPLLSDPIISPQYLHQKERLWISCCLGCHNSGLAVCDFWQLLNIGRQKRGGLDRKPCRQEKKKSQKTRGRKITSVFHKGTEKALRGPGTSCTNSFCLNILFGGDGNTQWD